MRCSSFLYPESIARCQHIKINGVQCGSPALNHRRLCFFHHKSQQRRTLINANRARRSRVAFELPLLEDANSIQVALMQVMNLLLTHQIEHKTASLLLYALQTASTNLRHTQFEPARENVVIDPRGVADTSLGDHAWYKEEFEDDEDEEGEEEGEESSDGTPEQESDDELTDNEEEDDEEEENKENAESVNLHAVASSVPRSRAMPEQLAVFDACFDIRVRRFNKSGQRCRVCGGSRPQFHVAHVLAGALQ